ncbi:MAG: CinA family protein [Anaerolineae bacterium]|nr:CinA family protein [Anaerolineae bacterium]
MSEGESSTAETLAQLLADRGLSLGTVECATGGSVGHRLFDTEEGPAVLGSSLNVETVEEAIDVLGLPWHQFQAGAFSAKAARAAARVGRDFLETDLCLAVWAEPLPEAATEVHETVYLALHTGEDVLDETLHYDGATGDMAGWLAEEALGFVRRALA